MVNKMDEDGVKSPVQEQRDYVMEIDLPDGKRLIDLMDIPKEMAERLKQAGFHVRQKRSPARKNRKFSKFTKEVREKILELLSNGQTIALACEAVGVSTSHFLKYRQTHPEFDKAVRAAMKGQICHVEDSLYQTALNGNVTAQIFFLVNRTRHMPRDSPDRWMNLHSVEMSGPGGGSIDLNVSIEERKERIARMLEEFVGSGGFDKPRIADLQEDSGAGRDGANGEREVTESKPKSDGHDEGDVQSKDA